MTRAKNDKFLIKGGKETNRESIWERLLCILGATIKRGNRPQLWWWFDAFSKSLQQVHYI